MKPRGHKKPTKEILAKVPIRAIQQRLEKSLKIICMFQ